MGQGERRHEPSGKFNKQETRGDRNRFAVEAGAWPLLEWRWGYDPFLNIQKARGAQRQTDGGVGMTPCLEGDVGFIPSGDAPKAACYSVGMTLIQRGGGGLAISCSWRGCVGLIPS